MLLRTAIATGIACVWATLAPAQDANMSFFITSENPGKGADLGGLAGADAYCTKLVEAAGVTGKVWAAYLSTSTENARDRIGTGPWVNAKGVEVAANIDELHSDANKLSKQNSLNEKGEVVNGRGDKPNRHNILTGSTHEGTLQGTARADWTSGDEGTAMVGHHDRTGGGKHPKSWHSAHGTKAVA